MVYLLWKKLPIVYCSRANAAGGWDLAGCWLLAGGWRGQIPQKAIYRHGLKGFGGTIKPLVRSLLSTETETSRQARDVGSERYRVDDGNVHLHGTTIRYHFIEDLASYKAGPQQQGGRRPGGDLVITADTLVG